jgi:hypothetical protein
MAEQQDLLAARDPEPVDLEREGVGAGPGEADARERDRRPDRRPRVRQGGGLAHPVQLEAGLAALHLEGALPARGDEGDLDLLGTLELLEEGEGDRVDPGRVGAVERVLGVELRVLPLRRRLALRVLPALLVVLLSL